MRTPVSITTAIALVAATGCARPEAGPAARSVCEPGGAGVGRAIPADTGRAMPGGADSTLPAGGGRATPADASGAASMAASGGAPSGADGEVPDGSGDGMPADGTSCGASAPSPVPRGVPSARVVRVVDGDTLVLALGGRPVRVRLIGLDAPETWVRHDCFGVQASRALRRLAPPGAVVRVVGDRRPYDRYGRRLLYVWTARGRFVEEELVRGGFARALPIPPNTRHAALLRAAELAARRTGAGLWRACA